MNSMYPIGNNLKGGPLGPLSYPTSPWSDSRETTPFPFLETLDITNPYNLKNDPINHNLHWPPIPHKIIADISKFEGKQRDDLATHVTPYHLWYVSNSMVDYSIWLRLFPHTLTGNAAKWYNELPYVSFNTFGALAM